METIFAVESFLKSKRAKGLSKRTISWYRIILAKFATMFPELPQKPETIDEFLTQCQAGDERRHGYFRTIRVFYRFLARRYEIKNIIQLVEAPKRRRKNPRPLTLDELHQLLSFPHQKRIKAALMFISDCGARVGETAGLSTQDLSITEYGPVARITGKTGARTVPIGEQTYHLLSEILPFKLSPNHLSRLLSWAFQDAHVRGSAVNLRHTFATYWDGDEGILQNILGHSHISTTQVYRKLRNHKIFEQHHQYSPLKQVLSGRQSSFVMGYNMDRNNGLS